MTINDALFSVDLGDILNELVSQMRMNNISYIRKMIPTSRDIQICCPYHSEGMERRPSAGISRDTGIFHCFACEEVHSLPEVISYCFGYIDDSGKYGWNWLLKNFMTISIEDRKDLTLDLSRDKKEEKKPNYVTEEELDKYRYIHSYMYKRKLTDEIIELFDIGYDKDTNCITFPNRDIDGNCLFIARRSVQTKYFNYPSKVEKPVYGLYELSEQIKGANSVNGQKHYIASYDEIIICESMLDALTCCVYGKPAVALNGLGTDLQFKQLRDFPCRHYILATDMDERGLNARERIKKGLYGKLVTEYRWDPKVAKDINEMSQEFFLNLVDHF